MVAERPLPAIAAGVEIADFDTELVALVVADRRAVHLESAHAIVLDSCRRGDSVARVSAELAAATGQTADDIEGWVDEVVQELARLGLVTTAAADADDRPA